jgi:hypothetical protein
MKLIIVQRSKPQTYERLKKQFEDDLNVSVIKERRRVQRRRTGNDWGPERRSRDRRRFTKPYGSRDYIVIYISK